MPARVLYELTARAAEITRGSETRLLVNDRCDIARAAGADGVHLTAQSLPADVVRKIYGPEFLIGVSTHSLDEARAARDGGADFVVFGPVFETESKRGFGAPQGLEKLAEVTNELRGFPVLRLVVLHSKTRACFEAGASGVAAIRLLNDAERMSSIVEVTEVFTSEAKPVVLTIAGLDPSGGAGIVADIKTISRSAVFLRRR